MLPTNTEEIDGIISSLKNKKSTGIDDIHAKTIKEIAKSILGPLTYLFNLILNSNAVPKIFKISVIKPIHKAGDKLLCQNCRPYLYNYKLCENI